MMLYRRQILLALLEQLGGKVGATKFQKFLFLLAEKQAIPTFDFVPYRYGCFSHQSYADRRWLENSGYLEENSKDLTLRKSGDYFSTLKRADREAIQCVLRDYGSMHRQDLLYDIYSRHPFFALKSKLKNSVLSIEEIKALKTVIPSRTSPALVTVGYEGLSVDAYFSKLLLHDVKFLCDIRRNPISRKYGFSKSTLSKIAEKLGIHYLHIPELGIASEKRKGLGKIVSHAELFREYERETLIYASKQLDEVTNLVGTYGRVAITCFEADHCHCHRGRVASFLKKQRHEDFAVEHI